MNTVTYTASLYDQRNTSTWATGYARHGKYTTTMHRGLIVFPELANNAMRGKQISDIGLTLVASSSGYGSSYTKNATFYTTSKTEASGTSTSWIASENLAGVISDGFFNVTKTYPSLATSHPSLFANLKTFFENGGQALGMYVNEEPTSKDYSYNYLQFSSVVMTVTYENGNLWRYDGSNWINCDAYYHNGTEFVRCNAFRHNGSAWQQ